MSNFNYDLVGAVGASTGTSDELKVVSWSRDYLELYNPTSSSVTTYAGVKTSGTQKYAPSLLAIFVRNDISGFSKYTI